MRKILLIFFFSILSLSNYIFIFAPPLLAQQVDTAWVRRYNGPGNGNDIATAIAVDSTGNVYVTGGSVGIATSDDYTTIKYYPNGDTAWVRRYNGPGNSYDEAYAIALDGSGNVYVTGESFGSGTDYDYATIKYDPAGNQLWVKRYNGPGNSADWADAIAVDGSSNLYVTGDSYGSGTSSDYATVKYDPQGNQFWVQRYNGPGNSYDWAHAIAVDGSGNVLVTGASKDSGTSYDYTTVKYDPQGNQLWVQRYNGPGNSEDWALAIAIDGSNNVYVTGESFGSGTSSDYATVKYDPQGNQLWVQRYNGQARDDYAWAIAIDGSNNVYVTGISYGSGTDYDYATIKYDSLGNELWVRRYNGPADSTDWAHAIAIDGSNNVYVTGESFGSGIDYDYATVKYDPQGNQVWVQRYNGPGNSYDEAYAIALDGSGNIYVTGESFGSGTSDDYATIKYVQKSVNPKLKIIAVPLNWQGDQQSFDDLAVTQINVFLDQTPLSGCRDRVLVKKLSVQTQNFSKFSCKLSNCGVGSIKPFVEGLLGSDTVAAYDFILGFAEHSPCSPIAGCSNGSDVIWSTSSYEVVTAHEMGHLYNLEDEYCSNPAGSNDSRCNDGGPPYGGNDINYLDALLGCDPRNGFGCCNDCSGSYPNICCQGNQNGSSGRCVMSYANAPGPRLWCQYCSQHLNAIPQLECQTLYRLKSLFPNQILDIAITIYSNDSVIGDRVTLLEGEPDGFYQTEGNYRISLVNSFDSSLFNAQFKLYFDYDGPVIDTVDYSYINYLSRSIGCKIPYQPEMDELRIYHDTNLIFSQTINFCDQDGSCDIGESYLTCPSDCPMNKIDHICITAQDGFCDPDCDLRADLDCPACGDANNDGKITVSDVVFLVSYLFKGGSPPFAQRACDANSDGSITVGDIVYLVNYLFKGGPPPAC